MSKHVVSKRHFLSLCFYTFIIEIKNMAIRETLLRRKLIINKLNQAHMTWEEIDVYLKQQSEILGLQLNLSRRQFQRDIKDIFLLFAIEIKNEISTKKYYINKEDSLFQGKIDSLEFLTLLNLSENSPDQIIFEKRQATGIENISQILYAIRNKRLIKFSYKKFYENYVEERSLLPICVKESSKRWYLIGHDLDRNDLRVFALDRISAIENGRKFKEKFDIKSIQTLFNHCFGIILPKKDQQIEEVILSYTGFQGQYLKTLPLHHTQQILMDKPHLVKLKLELYITQDFIMEILSAGSNVNVIAPQSLIETIKSEHLNALNNETIKNNQENIFKTNG